MIYAPCKRCYKSCGKIWGKPWQTVEGCCRLWVTFRGQLIRESALVQRITVQCISMQYFACRDQADGLPHCLPSLDQRRQNLRQPAIWHSLQWHSMQWHSLQCGTVCNGTACNGTACNSTACNVECDRLSTVLGHGAMAQPAMWHTASKGTTSNVSQPAMAQPAMAKPAMAQPTMWHYNVALQWCCRS